MTSLTEENILGPMKSWRHHHFIEETRDGAKLTDDLEFQHKEGWRGLLAWFMFNIPCLYILFYFRHFQTSRYVNKAKSS